MSLDYHRLLSTSKKPIMVQGMYYSNQRMLFIGEGDFSFSSSIATQFGMATNIVATSRDSKGLLQKYYGNDALKNIDNLHHLGAQVHHGVDVDQMVRTSEGVLPLGQSVFDVIIFNFPHAGFFGCEKDPNVIWMHQKLMISFFKIAAFMLSHGGLVYVSHKCGSAYENWNLPYLAQMYGLEFLENIPFCSTHFPGYKHRRGSGEKAGKLFPLDKATTYIFQIRDSVWIGGNKEHPMQTQERNTFLLEISNLQTFRKKEIQCGRASSETPLLQIIATEVARLEALKLGLKKQRKLKRLKFMLKVIHMVVETPSAVQDRRITSLQATSSCKKWQKSAQKVVKKAVEEERRERTLLSEKCREQVMCDSAMLKVMHLVVETPSALQDRRITSLQATSSCENSQEVQKTAQNVAKKATEEERRERTLLSEKCREQVMCDSAMLKVMHLVVETPSALQDLRITSLQATSSCENSREVQKAAQNVAKKATGEKGREQTLLPENCREQAMCDSAKNECLPKQQREVQVEEVLEIHESDDYIFADEPPLESEEGDDNYKGPVLCALVLENQTPLSGLQDHATEPENNSGRKIGGRNCIDRIDQEVYMYSQEEDQSDWPDLEFSQNSDEDHGDLPEVLESFHDSETELSKMLLGDEVLGVCKVMKDWESEDMAGEHFPLQFSLSFAETISIWISTYICSCFGKKN